MVNFSNNSFSTLKKLVNQKLFKKILIISGKKSYFASGAEKLIKTTLKDKETYLLLKKNKYPEIKEHIGGKLDGVLNLKFSIKFSTSFLFFQPFNSISLLIASLLVEYFSKYTNFQGIPDFVDLDQPSLCRTRRTSTFDEYP